MSRGYGEVHPSGHPIGECEDPQSIQDPNHREGRRHSVGIAHTGVVQTISEVLKWTRKYLMNHRSRVHREITERIGD